MSVLTLERPSPATTRIPHRPRRGVEDRRRTTLVLAGALLATLVIRLLYVGFPLGIDEGGVAFVAKAWGTGHGSLYGAYWLDRPPLLLALYKVAILAGPIGVRALGALAALGLVVATTLLARSVAGERAARIAAVLCTALASSIALTAVFTPAELLASVPATASIGCLVAAHRSRRVRWLVGAGLLAVSAALIKQSFLDAGFAGAAYLIAMWARDRRLPLRALVAYGAGAAIPLAVVAVWLAVAHVSVSSLAYALFGFRITALHVLSVSNLPLHVRLESLIRPVLGSGLFLVGPLALAGLGRLRRDRVVLAVISAWLAAGSVGVLGGGSYWPHYLLQIVAPVSVSAAIGLAAVRRPRLRTAAVAGLATLAIGITVAGAIAVQVHPRLRPDLAVASYVRTHAQPGDTQYVMYARANVDYYTGLSSPFPYAWSLLMRAVPGAPERLASLLGSAQRPTWVIGWQPPDRWQLDPHGATARALQDGYRVVAHVDGYPIYHRVLLLTPPQSRDLA